ncbi:MAG: phosphate ABC transporter permease subunit PstC [Gemmatimonadetes bacterium]|nr:phosphate ABC transporter permease subunit PstC [Gemmatimonadota bacterium]
MTDVRSPLRLSGRARGATADRLYGITIAACAAVIPCVLLLVGSLLVSASWPTLSARVGDLVTGLVWDVPKGRFGAFPAVVGTLATSLLAVCIATPLALSTAIVTAELAPRAVREPLAFVVNVLAAIPSVVYGLWGIFVLVPFLRSTAMPLLAALPVLGDLFAGPAYGPSLMAAALLLAIMLLPYVAGVSRDVLLAVPRAQREAALALGATRWEMIRDAVLPSARAGLVGAVMLGLARALGETIAVAMVIGNRHALPTSLVDPAYSMAALLANEFAEASSADHVAALMSVATLLLAVTLVVNLLARWLVARVARGAGALGRLA